MAITTSFGMYEFVRMPLGLGLNLKPSKCLFGVPSINFLSYEISAN